MEAANGDELQLQATKCSCPSLTGYQLDWLPLVETAACTVPSSDLCPASSAASARLALAYGAKGKFVNMHVLRAVEDKLHCTCHVTRSRSARSRRTFTSPICLVPGWGTRPGM